MATLKYNYINKNKFSRPGFKLLRVSKIVMHYTANPGAGADNHRRYFRDLKGRYASAHIFIDDKEAICIIPLNEVAYHANEKACRVQALKATTSYYAGGNANLTSIGIEMCLDKNGNITSATFNRSVDVVAELCKTYNLTASDIIRHYDVTGKNCPAPWVAKPSELTRFRNAVNAKLKGSATTSKPHTPASKNTYYTENPKKIKTLVQCDLYNSVDFTEKHKTGGTYPAGTIFTISGMGKTKGGTPRLKTKSGYYLTANTKFVKKI